MHESYHDRARYLKRQRHIEWCMKTLLCACAWISIVTTAAIALVLVRESMRFFTDVSVIEFFTTKEWTPLFEPSHFGVWPLVSGTFLVVCIAGCVAIPMGLCGAICLSEYIPDTIRRLLKPVLEVLAGIPSLVYGYFALTFVTPVLQAIIPEVNIFNALSAGLVMGVMILPLVCSLSEDAMLAVPRTLRMGAYALGATRFEVVWRVVVPSALSGIASAFILGFSRAIGETMVVAIAAGSSPVFTFDPRQSIQTMTAYIAQMSLGETPQGTVVFQTLFAVALMLFILTLAMNTLSNWVVKRWGNRY